MDRWLGWLRPSPGGHPRAPWWWTVAGLVAILSLVGTQFVDAPGLLERGDSWWRAAVSLPALAVLLLAWWQIGPRFRRQWIPAAVWSAPMLMALAMYSRDADEQARLPRIAQGGRVRVDPEIGRAHV